MSTNPVLIAVELIAASIWTGGMVCITVVFRTARRVLDQPAQAKLFRSVGRRYGVIGTTSLVVAVVAGVGLSWPPTSWSDTITVTFVLAALLIVTTVVGMKQARFMSSLRRELAGGSRSATTVEALRRGHRVANALRGAMGVMTFGVIILASFAVAH